MSVCAHDPNCPGYGSVHDRAISTASQLEVYSALAEVIPESNKQIEFEDAVKIVDQMSEEELRATLPEDFMEVYNKFTEVMGHRSKGTVVNSDKDRSLSGKDRKRARKAARRG